MLSVERNSSGDFVLVMPGPALAYLSGVPTRLRAVLRDPEGSRAAFDRLFPVTYKDKEYEEEHRKLMHEELVQRKLDNVDAFDKLLKGSTVDFTESEVIVPGNQFEAWLGFVNDMRLVLGTQLGVEKEDWEDEVPEDDPQAESYFLLHFLSILEEMLLRATGLEFDGHPDGSSDQ
ncbi:MAG: DUF2017 domain-containing protein [Planctomycetes bacterium]|nr:DUF2017 domain-containing protein [Planctomycetota bacterium]